MKRLIAAAIISTMTFLSACNETAPNPDEEKDKKSDTTEDSPAQDTSEYKYPADAKSAFAINSYISSVGNESFYYETTPEELISIINTKMTDGGYSEFELKDTYISENDDFEDSYYYYTEGKRGKLTINTYHGIGKVVQAYVVLNDANDEDTLKLNHFIVESMIDSFAPKQGKSISEKLDIYSVRPEDEYDYRELVFGSSKYRLSVPDEFTIWPKDY
jgi:hypothetical protein